MFAKTLYTTIQKFGVFKILIVFIFLFFLSLMLTKAAIIWSKIQ